MIKKIKITDGRHSNKARPTSEAPNNRDYHILEALRDGHSMAEVGRVYGLSRQYIFYIKNRWPHLAPRKKRLIKKHTQSKGGNHGISTTLRSRRSTV